MGSDTNTVWDRLMVLLLNATGDETAYAYRFDPHGMPTTPYLLKCSASTELLSVLRDTFGGGAFRLLIRRGKVLIFAGSVHIAEPAAAHRTNATHHMHTVSRSTTIHRQQ
jgi:hypothetical protein